MIKWSKTCVGFNRASKRRIEGCGGILELIWRLCSHSVACAAITTLESGSRTIGALLCTCSALFIGLLVAPKFPLLCHQSDPALGHPVYKTSLIWRSGRLVGSQTEWVECATDIWEAGWGSHLEGLHISSSVQRDKWERKGKVNGWFSFSYSVGRIIRFSPGKQDV